MAKVVASVYMVSIGGLSNPYVDDAEQQRNVNSTPTVPSPLLGADNSALAGLYATGGGAVASVGGQTINNALIGLPCSDTDSITPRKIRLVFGDGSSTSIPVTDRNNLVSVASSARDQANGLAEGTEVACIQLIGERISDLLLELGGNFDGSPKQSVRYARYYSGNANYTIDGSFQSVSLAYKIGSDDPTRPPEALQQSWNSCVGELTNSRGCGGRSSRFGKRKFIPSYIIGETTNQQSQRFEETHEIPVANATGIVTCGEQIVSELGGSLFCLPYEGHSDSRFHLVQGVGLGG